MTKDELLKQIKDNTCPPWCWAAIQDAIDAYSSSLLQQSQCRALLFAYTKYLMSHKIGITDEWINSNVELFLSKK